MLNINELWIVSTVYNVTLFNGRNNELTASITEDDQQMLF